MPRSTSSAAKGGNDTHAAKGAGDLRPAKGGGNLRPAKGGGDTRPAKGGGDTRPAKGGGDTRPAKGGGDTRPAKGAGDTHAAGRARILDSAETLMAERGAFAVSLRAINAAAGQKNASGVQYHFGGREGLIAAVVARHMSVVDARRNQMLDALEAGKQTADVRALVAALVEPLAERLQSAGGRAYLRILLQLANQPAADGQELDFTVANRSLQRVGKQLGKLAPALPPKLAGERTAQLVLFVLHALADQAHRLEAGRRRAPLPNLLFTANLVDVLAAVIAAPPSAETRRLAQR